MLTFKVTFIVFLSLTAFPKVCTNKRAAFIIKKFFPCAGDLKKKWWGGGTEAAAQSDSQVLPAPSPFFFLFFFK